MDKSATRQTIDRTIGDSQEGDLWDLCPKKGKIWRMARACVKRKKNYDRTITANSQGREVLWRGSSDWV